MSPPPDPSGGDEGGPRGPTGPKGDPGPKGERGDPGPRGLSGDAMEHEHLLEIQELRLQTEVWKAQLSAALTELRGDVQEVKDRLEKRYVTEEAFSPVRLVVYGLVATVMLTVLGAILALVLSAVKH